MKVRKEAYQKSGEACRDAVQGVSRLNRSERHFVRKTRVPDKKSPKAVTTPDSLIKDRKSDIPLGGIWAAKKTRKAPKEQLPHL